MDYTKCRICGKPAKKGLCVKHRSAVRRHRQKIAAIELLGGKCVRCDEDRIEVLQLHHKDPIQKEFAICSVINKSWDIIKKEVLKCEILCSNCHMLEHQDRSGEKFLEIVFEYGKTKKSHTANREIIELLEKQRKRNLRLV